MIASFYLYIAIVYNRADARKITLNLNANCFAAAAAGLAMLAPTMECNVGPIDAPYASL